MFYDEEPAEATAEEKADAPVEEEKEEASE